jgi:hypothetical protein
MQCCEKLCDKLKRVLFLSATRCLTSKYTPGSDTNLYKARLYALLIQYALLHPTVPTQSVCQHSLSNIWQVQASPMAVHPENG